MIALIFLQVLEISLFTSVLIAVLLVLTPLFQKRYSAKWRCFVWLAVSFRLLMPISFPLFAPPINFEIPDPVHFQEYTNPAHNIGPVATESGMPQTAPIAEGGNGLNNPGAYGELAAGTEPTSVSSPVYESLSEELSGSSFSFIDIAAFIWLSGAVAFLFVQIGVYQLFLKKLRAAKNETVPDFVTETLRQTGAALNFGRLPEILITKTVDAPVLVGILYPRILLPHSQYEPEKLSFILRHELVHFKRGHMFFKLALVLLKSVHWFNPIIYFMSVQAAKDIELVCDSEAVNGLDKEALSGYGDTILSVMPRKRRLEPILSTHFGSGKENMKQRLANLFDTRAKHRGIVLLCSIIFCAIIITGFVSFDHTAGSRSVPLSGGTSMMKLGIFQLELGDIIKSELSWAEPGTLIVLYTNKDYTENEILEAALSRADSINGVFYSHSSTASPLEGEQSVAETDLYSFYIIYSGSSDMIPISGAVTRVSSMGFTNLWVSSPEQMPLDPFGVSAYSKDGSWASGGGIDGSTWRNQADREIGFLEHLYSGHNTDFVISEVLPAAQASDIERIRYLYDNSDVFRKMSSLDGGIHIGFFDGNSSYLTPEVIHQTTFMLESGQFRLDMDYSFEDAQMDVWLIDPTGKTVYQSGFSSFYKGGRTVMGENGLWRLVRVFRSDNGNPFTLNISLTLSQIGDDSASGARSQHYEGMVAARSAEVEIPFPALNGDAATFSLDKPLQGWGLDSDEIVINLVIAGNDGTTQEVTLRNSEPKKEITIKETANHNITVHNSSDQLVNYSILMTLDTKRPNYISPQFGANSSYTSADDEAITRMDLSGTWGDYIELLLPDMSPEAVETVVNIYLDSHLFPGVTTADGARQAAETVAKALEYMDAEAREAAEKMIEAYY